MVKVLKPFVNPLVHFLEKCSDEDEGVQTMRSKMLTMETNKLYLLLTLLDPYFKIRVFSSQSAVTQARQCLIEEYILIQSLIPEAPDTSPANKRRHIDSRPNQELQEESSLWSSFDSMIQTGE